MSIEADQMNLHRESGSIFSRQYLLSGIFALLLCGVPAALAVYVNSELAALIHLVIVLLGSVRSHLKSHVLYVYLYIGIYYIVHESTFKILEVCGPNLNFLHIN